MDPGDLNCLILIQKPAKARDGAGQRADVWDDVTEVWASIKGQSGMGTITGLQGNVPAAVALYSIRIRFREDILPGMRALYRGRVFRIRQVKLDYATREYTDLICEEGAP